MSGSDDDDVPTGVNFHDPEHAARWTDETPRKRPHRVRFFAAFVRELEQVAATCGRPVDVLELGSGPGHLAREIIRRVAIRSYTALDFSEPMHALARAQLGDLALRVTFVTRDFRAATWPDGLGSFDAVVTLQAAHETRHVRHLVPLLERARTTLRSGGLMLYCDHYCVPGDGRNPRLLPARAEQARALEAAGFHEVRVVHEGESMALYAARSS